MNVVVITASQPNERPTIDPEEVNDTSILFNAKKFIRQSQGALIDESTQKMVTKNKIFFFVFYLTII